MSNNFHVPKRMGSKWKRRFSGGPTNFYLFCLSFFCFFCSNAFRILSIRNKYENQTQKPHWYITGLIVNWWMLNRAINCKRKNDVYGENENRFTFCYALVYRHSTHLLFFSVSMSLSLSSARFCRPTNSLNVQKKKISKELQVNTAERRKAIVSVISRGSRKKNGTKRIKYEAWNEERSIGCEHTILLELT